MKARAKMLCAGFVAFILILSAFDLLWLDGLPFAAHIGVGVSAALIAWMIGYGAIAKSSINDAAGLPDRVGFQRRADDVLKSGMSAALLVVGLDRFKEVNDNLGHMQGDDVLAEVAERLRAAVEEGNQLSVRSLQARLASDEFAMLVPAESEADALAAAGTVLARIMDPLDRGGRTICLDASIGIAMHPHHGREFTRLLKAADMAMYHAKSLGGGEIAIFDANLALAVEQKLRTERALREAVAQKQFELAYQPQVCARTGRVVAVEALLRWNHPTEGIRFPDSFISVAEDTNLIVPMGEWVVEAAMRTAKEWQAAGLKQRLTINVSPSQIERSNFFEHFRECLKQSGVSPSLLELELTETMVLQCNDAIMAELAALRAMDVAVAIDDFGAGYSNLARMKDVPVDRVKLDRSLIQDIDTSESARTIVSAVVHLVHGLGCEVVAEGVERREQLAVLRAMGCDIIQGFAFATPMSEPKLRDWVVQRCGEERLSLIA